jgi:hypothetical protein
MPYTNFINISEMISDSCCMLTPSTKRLKRENLSGNCPREHLVRFNQLQRVAVWQ